MSETTGKKRCHRVKICINKSPLGTKQNCRNVYKSNIHTHAETQTHCKENTHAVVQTTVCGGHSHNHAHAQVQTVCKDIFHAHAQTDYKHNAHAHIQTDLPIDFQEHEYQFPFIGKTASGDLKIRPDMISFENPEFAVIVANPDCIRTTVKKQPHEDVSFSFSKTAQDLQSWQEELERRELDIQRREEELFLRIAQLESDF